VARSKRDSNTTALVDPRRLSGPSTGDLIAGLSVALVAIPQSLAYAELAGMPAHIGLFASALPSLLAAAFVSSRYLQTGPVALTALLTFGALSPLAEPFSSEYIALAALLALMVGIMRVILGAARLGGLAYLLSEPVLVGFTTGAAVLIVSSQLPKVFDVAPDEGGVLANAFHAVTHPGDWSGSAIAFSVVVFVLMFGGRRLHRLFPGVLVAVVIGVIVSRATNYSGSTVGELDGGFISLQFNFVWSSFADLLLPAFAIALVGFAEPSSIARTFAAEERLPWNANKEMVSQGIANLAAGVSGAFPVGGSFSRSSLNRLAGATSPWAGALTGFFVLMALPLTPVLEPLPRAILGAIVLGAVLKLIRFGELLKLVRDSPRQGLVGVGTLIATLAAAPRIERGVMVGVVLALVVHLVQQMNVRADSSLDNGVLTIRPLGVLWFAAVPKAEATVRQELARHPEAHTVLLDLSSVGQLDVTAAAALRRVCDELEGSGIDVRVTKVPPGASEAAALHLRNDS
jgi:SulP family sulfate permease